MLLRQICTLRKCWCVPNFEITAYWNKPKWNGMFGVLSKVIELNWLWTMPEHSPENIMFILVWAHQPTYATCSLHMCCVSSNNSDNHRGSFFFKAFQIRTISIIVYIPVCITSNLKPIFRLTGLKMWSNCCLPTFVSAFFFECITYKTDLILPTDFRHSNQPKISAQYWSMKCVKCKHKYFVYISSFVLRSWYEIDER